MLLLRLARLLDAVYLPETLLGFGLVAELLGLEYLDAVVGGLEGEFGFFEELQGPEIGVGVGLLDHWVVVEGRGLHRMLLSIRKNVPLLYYTTFFRETPIKHLLSRKEHPHSSQPQQKNITPG